MPITRHPELGRRPPAAGRSTVMVLLLVVAPAGLILDAATGPVVSLSARPPLLDAGPAP